MLYCIVLVTASFEIIYLVHTCAVTTACGQIVQCVGTFAVMTYKARPNRFVRTSSLVPTLEARLLRASCAVRRHLISTSSLKASLLGLVVAATSLKRVVVYVLLTLPTHDVADSTTEEKYRHALFVV